MIDENYDWTASDEELLNEKEKIHPQITKKEQIKEKQEFNFFNNQNIPNITESCSFYLQQPIEMNDILISSECEEQKHADETTKENDLFNTRPNLKKTTIQEKDKGLENILLSNIERKDQLRLRKIYEYFQQDKIEDEKIIERLKAFEVKIDKLLE